MTFIPPIKCQGIKSKLVPWLLKVTAGYNYKTWIEPFMGSGVVGFNINPVQAIFSDTNPHLINFYQAITTKDITPDAVRKFLQEEGQKLSRNGDEYYYQVRERFNSYHSPLDFLFLNRCCFNGLIRFNKKGGFNVPFGHKPQRFSKPYITKIVNQVSWVADRMQKNDWQFKHQDFSFSLTAATVNDLIYCDPPYVGRHTDYFNSWSDQDELHLYHKLKKSPARFFLSTWHSNQHRENPFVVGEGCWSEFEIATRPRFYHVGARKLNRKPMLEALITSN